MFRGFLLESVVFPNGNIRISCGTLRYVRQASLRRAIFPICFLKISWLFLDKIFLRCTTVYFLWESVRDKNHKIEISAPRAQPLAFSEPKESKIFIAGATITLARFHSTIRYLLRKPEEKTRDTNRNKTSSIWHLQSCKQKKWKVAEKPTSTKSCKTATHAVMPVFWCSSFQGCQSCCFLSAYLS